LHKYAKNQRSATGSQEPDNRGFSGFFNERDQKNLQVQQVPGIIRHCGLLTISSKGYIILTLDFKGEKL
jgi:hypothetical protein